MAKKIVPPQPPAGASKTLNGITWIAERPAVLPYLVKAQVYDWGMVFVFRGSKPDDLIAAGIVTAEMFENMGKSGRRTRSLDSGDRYTVKQRPTFCEIGMDIRDGSGDDSGPPNDVHPRPSHWWRKHGGEAEAATAAILARLSATRRTAHG